MNILYDKESFTIHTYLGDEDEDLSVEQKNNKNVFCSTITMYDSNPISLKNKLGAINENVTMFILPYKKGDKTFYTVYCYTFNDLKKFLYSNQPSFKYKPGADESFPVIKLQGSGGLVYIRLNYFLLLRYSTFVLFDPQEMSIGSSYGGLGNIHGGIETVCDVHPINKKNFLESQNIEYINDLEKEDFTPGNFPPYKIEMIYEDTLIREREKSEDNIVIENVFFKSGDFIMSLFNKNTHTSTRFFSCIISYNKDDSGYLPERRFSYNTKNIIIDDVEVKIKKRVTVYDIEVTRGGEKVIHEYLSPWTEKQFDDGTEYKSIKEEESEITNPLLKLVESVGEEWNWKYLSSNPNITMKDVLDNPDTNIRKWNWDYLSKNPSITMKDVLDNPDTDTRKWNWNNLSSNPNITIKDVSDNPGKPWSWYGLSENPNITMEYVNNNPDNLNVYNRKWNFTSLSCNPNITMKDVLDNPDTDTRKWDWISLSSNPNITLKDVIDNPDKPWNWYRLSKNPNITMEDVKNNPDKPWVLYGLSKNPNITMEYVNNNPDNWDWYNLSCNPNITLNDFLDNPDNPWDLFEFSFNPSITIKDVLDNPFIHWDWKRLSKNSSITIEDIKDNPGKPWYWSVLGQSNLKVNIIKKLLELFPDKPWDWELLTTNPNIDYDYIKDHPEFPWEMDKLHLNPTIPFKLLVENNIIPENNDIIDAFGSSYNISLQDIKNNPDIHWDWKYGISYNPNVTKEFIIENKNKDWDFLGVSRNKNISIDFIIQYSRNELQFTEDELYDCLSYNPNINIEYVKENIYKPWDWSELSKNKGITIRDIIDNNSEDFKWDWNFVCKNPNFQMRHLKIYRDTHWSLNHLSGNPNSDLKTILNNKDTIDFEELSNNPFGKWRYVL